VVVEEGHAAAQRLQDGQVRRLDLLAVAVSDADPGRGGHILEEGRAFQLGVGRPFRLEVEPLRGGGRAPPPPGARPPPAPAPRRPAPGCPPPGRPQPATPGFCSPLGPREEEGKGGFAPGGAGPPGGEGRYGRSALRAPGGGGALAAAPPSQRRWTAASSGLPL